MGGHLHAPAVLPTVVTR